MKVRFPPIADLLARHKLEEVAVRAGRDELGEIIVADPECNPARECLVSEPPNGVSRRQNREAFLFPVRRPIAPFNSLMA